MTDVFGTELADSLTAAENSSGSIHGYGGADTISALTWYGTGDPDWLGTFDMAYGGSGDDLFKVSYSSYESGSFLLGRIDTGFFRNAIAIGGDGADTLSLTGPLLPGWVYVTESGIVGSRIDEYRNLTGPSSGIDDSDWYTTYQPSSSFSWYNVAARTAAGEEVEAYSLNYASLYGSDQAENIIAKGSIVFSYGGNDTISVTHSSLVHGGDGDDYITGSNGQSTGDDHLEGGAGNDTVFGDEGNDTVRGGDGADFVVGHLGDDYVQGNDGADTLWGSEGSDFIQGGNGNDLIHGQANGSSYEAALWFDGPSDIEHIHGNDGDDTIVGGIGQDNILGGAGADLFHVGDEQGYIEALFDFSQAEGDRIQIPAFSGLHDWITVRSPEEAVANQVHPTANESWVFIGTDTYGVENWVAAIGTSQLTASDFVFV